MNPQTKQLVEAANALIGDLINKRPHFDSFQNLCKILATFEQSTEQVEAISGEKTARDFICLDCHTQWDIVERTISYDIYGTENMMERYASQQTASKDKQLQVQQSHIDDQDQLIFEQDRKIDDLQESLLQLIQVKEWKDKHGKDERYLKAMPIAWENARKLIQK